MSRSWGSIDPKERDVIRSAVHQEAHNNRWHELNNFEKGKLYRHWGAQWNVNHPALKDSVMKGFDVYQGIEPIGELKVHWELQRSLEKSLQGAVIPWFASKPSLGKLQPDFILGYSPAFPTHVIELEPATTWHTGLGQLARYSAKVEALYGRQVSGVMVLFGEMSKRAFEEAKFACGTNSFQLVGYKLRIDGGRMPHRLRWRRFMPASS